MLNNINTFILINLFINEINEQDLVSIELLILHAEFGFRRTVS